MKTTLDFLYRRIQKLCDEFEETMDKLPLPEDEFDSLIENLRYRIQVIQNFIREYIDENTNE